MKILFNTTCNYSVWDIGNKLADTWMKDFRSFQKFGSLAKPNLLSLKQKIAEQLQQLQ